MEKSEECEEMDTRMPSNWRHGSLFGSDLSLAVLSYLHNVYLESSFDLLLIFNTI